MTWDIISSNKRQYHTREWREKLVNKKYELNTSSNGI